MNMTPEQLSALPEWREFEDTVMPDGTTVRTRRVPKLSLRPLSPKDVAFFSDEDGSWAVDYFAEGGPYKRRVGF